MADEIPFRKTDDYLRQWRRNRKCSASLGSEFVDWQITVIFYTALHAINAAAAHLGEKPCDHKTRNDLVKSNEAFANVRTNYLLLYRLSRFTRYDPDPDSWLPEKFLTAQAVVDQVLTPIENYVEVLIGRKLNLSPLKVKD